MLRFAPSPTKDMNINDLRVAIFNYLVSKQLNKDLAVRIEDSNKEENIENKDKEILETLALFSIDYSRIIYQSEFLKYHQKMTMQLLTQRKAFSCFRGEGKLQELKVEAKKNNGPYRYDGFCETLSDEAVLEVNAPFTVRIKKPVNGINFTDILKGDINTSALDIDSFNILRHNKTPTYNYACAIDDMLMDVSFIIRDESHLLDTPKQIHIRNTLGYDKEIKYLHLPSLNVNDDEISIKWLIEEGFLPSAIANYLVLLGNKTPTEIFTLEEAIKWFKIEDISQESINFDIDKLRFINKKHLEAMDEMRLSKILGFADLDIGKLAKIYLEEVDTIKELKTKINAIFALKHSPENFKEEFIKIKECLQNSPYYDNFVELEKYIEEKTKLKGEFLSNPLQYLLTGSNKGPKIPDIYPFIKNYLGEIIK